MKRAIAALILSLTVVGLTGCTSFATLVDNTHKICGIIRDYKVSGHNCCVTVQLVSYSMGMPNVQYFQHGDKTLAEIASEDEQQEIYYFDGESSRELSFNRYELGVYGDDIDALKDKISIFTVQGDRIIDAELTDGELMTPVQYENNVLYELSPEGVYYYGLDYGRIYINPLSSSEINLIAWDYSYDIEVFGDSDDNIYVYMIDIDASDDKTELLFQSVSGKNAILYYNEDGSYDVLTINGELSFDGKGRLEAYIYEGCANGLLNTFSEVVFNNVESGIVDYTSQTGSYAVYSYNGSSLEFDGIHETSEVGQDD